MRRSKHTHAYAVWKNHSQQMLDFAVLICTAAPQLAHAFTAHATDPTVFLARNSAFRPSKQPYATEKRALPAYKHTLGATVLLSIFSYFETYFFTAVEEVLTFHGGAAGLEQLMRAQMASGVRSAEASTALEGLRTRHKGSRADKYRILTAKLRSERIVWPSQRFMLYGLKQLLARQKRWRAVDIPDLMRDLLVLDYGSREQYLPSNT